MRLEWIEDILAVLDTGSLARAAERRFLTQSAFTRRVRMIEESIGATIFDRRRKPVRLMPGVEMLEPELRDLASRLRNLRDSLQLSSRMSGRSLRFVCQHAITATVSPWIVRTLTAENDWSVRVRSGNQDECLMQLLAGDVDFAVMYEASGERTVAMPRAFESAWLGVDLFIPVCAPSLRAAAAGPAIPAISYPSDVFLGQVFDRTIRPRIPGETTLVTKAETALTLAARQYALSEIGLAWLPQSLVADDIARGRLLRVDDLLPAQQLDIRMIRLSEGQTEDTASTWEHLTERLKLPEALQGVPDGQPGLVEPVERTEERER